MRRGTICGGIALLVILAAACLPAELSAPSPTVAPTPTAAASPTATVAPGPTTSPVATPDPTPTVAGVPQLGGLVRSLTTGWRPAGEALILEQPGDQGGRVLSALPLDGSPRVPLVAFDQGESTGWDVRRDGSLAISIFTDPRSARIAVWDGATATARWATPAETGVLHMSPVWSFDGSSIYYSALKPPDDLGFFRVGATGLRPTRIRAPEGNGGTLGSLTPDGAGLVWSRIQAGSSADVLDLRTGRNVGFDPNTTAYATSWRDAQPRALVIKGGCCAGPPVGTLYVWDDREGTARAIFGREFAPDDGVSAAAWDPTGKRIVAAVWDLAVSMEIAQALVVMNEQGGERSSLAGTKDAVGLLWARAGIFYLTPGGGRDGGHGIGTEIMLVDPAGGAPRQFFRGEYVIRWVLLSP